MPSKKKPFIDKAEAAHFHLVHRSQRDPKVADPDAPQRVLKPLEGRRGASEKASQSTRAWLDEQDLGGFDELAVGAAPHEANSELGLPEDGYNYSQHLRVIGGGTFIPAPESVASHARSAASRLSRLSARSRAESFVLRGMPSEAFETMHEELEGGAGGNLNAMNAVDEEEDGAHLQDEMDEDLWAALHDDAADGEFEEINDDFVLQANVERDTELIADPVRKTKGQRKKEAELEERSDGEGEEGEGGLPPTGGTSRGAGKPGLAALMGWSDDDDDDDDDDEEKGKKGAAARRGKLVGEAPRQERLIDARFERLMENEYDDDEIGELEEDDPRVLGDAGLEAFESVMDDFLDKQHSKFVRIHDIMDTGSSRQHARVPSTEEDSGTCAPTGEEIDRLRKAKMDAKGNTLPGKEAELAALEQSDDDSDGSVQDHPFFDGLKEKPKEEEWDAETILSTYTTTDHHPTMIHMPRRVKPNPQQRITLDKQTGLPVGIVLPAEEERRKHAAALAAVAGGAAALHDVEEEEEYEPVNMGAARPKQETAEEKRQRKQMAKELKAERRAEKKGTKLAFKEEKATQQYVAAVTHQIKGAQSLAR